MPADSYVSFVRVWVCISVLLNITISEIAESVHAADTLNLWYWLQKEL